MRDAELSLAGYLRHDGARQRDRGAGFGQFVNLIPLPHVIHFPA